MEIIWNEEKIVADVVKKVYAPRCNSHEYGRLPAYVLSTPRVYWVKSRAVYHKGEQVLKVRMSLMLDQNYDCDNELHAEVVLRTAETREAALREVIALTDAFIEECSVRIPPDDTRTDDEVIAAALKQKWDYVA